MQTIPPKTDNYYMFWLKIHKLKIQVFTIWRSILQFAIQRQKRGTGNTKKDRNSCLHGNPNRFGFASKNHHKANNIQSAECFCEAGKKLLKKFHSSSYSSFGCFLSYRIKEWILKSVRVAHVLQQLHISAKATMFYGFFGHNAIQNCTTVRWKTV